MCSPELTRGMCAICYGTVTPDNAYSDDLLLWEDLHRGKCAILYGLGMNKEQRVITSDMIDTAHRLQPNSPERECMMRAYHAYVDAIATEDYYDNGGPE